MRWMYPAAVGTAVALVVACGDTSGPSGGTGSGGTPPSTPLATNLTVVQARDDFGQIGHEVIVAHLKNLGGAGSYRIEAWGRRTDGQDELFGTTEPVEAARFYEDIQSWAFYTGAPPIGPKNIQWIVVYSEDEGSSTFRQTARYDLAA
jgi:hypothetical protein